MALKGIRVVEFAGLAPAPFCGMILADFGASVVRIDRTGVGTLDRLSRGKRSIALNLKFPESINIIRKLCRKSDVLIEPYRPGVMEKFGLGPQELIAENPGLIYARLTGYGQEGPYKNLAGHDMNYIAISGILSQLGRKDDNPYAPLNLIADFAGGGLTCAFGIVAALLERTKSGRGQIIDANMVEGSAYVGSWVYKSQDMEFAWGKPRGCNLLDSGNPIYETYETQDGEYMAVACLEPQFRNAFFNILNLDESQFQDNEHLRVELTKLFKTKTRKQWSSIFANSDACVTPVLSLKEAARDEHNSKMASFLEGPAGPEPIPAPRLKRTPAVVLNTDHVNVGQHSQEILAELGYNEKDIQNFVDNSVTEIGLAKNSTSRSKL